MLGNEFTKPTDIKYKLEDIYPGKVIKHVAELSEIKNTKILVARNTGEAFGGTITMVGDWTDKKVDARIRPWCKVRLIYNEA